MKNRLLAALALVALAQPAFAVNNISTLQNLAQSEFRALSEDLGAALSYKPVTPAASLGVTGFDLGIGFSATSLKSSASWGKATGSSLSTLPLPKIHLQKGLPAGFDIGGFFSAVPGTDIKLYGAELRYAILSGGVTEPAVGVRGAFTRLSGVSQLSFDTQSLDVSVSKGFAMLTPYAGVGEVWVDSTPNVAGLVAESFTKSKVFVGANFNLGVNLAVEYDKTGSVDTYSVKAGFRF
ncbi:MAG: hypothetical protein AB1513_08585 [Pseudomonadota bacterium]